MVDIYNLGTGKGSSVLEVVHAFEKANDVAVPYQICERRAGDITILMQVADKVEKNSAGKQKTFGRGFERLGMAKYLEKEKNINMIFVGF